MDERKEEGLDGEIADADQGLESQGKDQRDITEQKEGSRFDEDDNREEHDENDEDWYENEYLEDAEDAGNKKKYILIAVLLGIIGAAGFLLWFMNDDNRKLADGSPPSQQTEPLKSNERSKDPEASFSSQGTRKPETKGQTKTSEHTAFGIPEKLEQTTRLRNELLNKQEEIRTLKHYYRDRIQEVRDEILNEKREKRITTFQQALESKRIELGLRTIRRRHSYINKLNGPLEQLHKGGEELLYIKRLTGIQIQMAPIVNGIDISKLGERMDIIIEKETRGADSLAIDTGESRVPALEEIWKEIVQEGEKPEKEKTRSQRQNDINMEIWKEICVGNLSRKYELTKLSLNAAKCLAQWKGKDLFLNGITELSAPIAEQLSQWGGEWLCFNRLTELSPEAAKSLSRWRGVRLSLNGLIKLTPQAAKHLSQWRGKQIEAVGLSKISPEANKYLTAWQEAGGEIYTRTSP
jgi:hypothetical protein